MMDIHNDGQPEPLLPIPSSENTGKPTERPLSYRAAQRQPSKENISHTGTQVASTRPISAYLGDVDTKTHGGPLNPVHVNTSSEHQIPQPSATQIENYSSYSDRSRTPSGEQSFRQQDNRGDSNRSEHIMKTVPPYMHSSSNSATHIQLPPAALLASLNNRRTSSPRIITPDTEGQYQRHISNETSSNVVPGAHVGIEGRESHGVRHDNVQDTGPITETLSYYHLGPNHAASMRLVNEKEAGSRIDLRPSTPKSARLSPVPTSDQNIQNRTVYLGENVSRPNSTASDSARRDQKYSSRASPIRHSRAASSQGRHSPDNRPASFINLLNDPYPQPAPTANLDNTHLQTAIGSRASLLSTKETLEMYRANVRKTNDPAIQYEFAIFMINAVQEAANQGHDLDSPRRASPHPGGDMNGSNNETRSKSRSKSRSRVGLLDEARQILQRLADKSYPFAQYYLADGYASGLFHGGKEDNDRAFPLFVSASKHGHVEAGYRAALCYEFGWGTRSDPTKAVQFYRQSASKNHPGAMERLGRACLAGELGLENGYREGLKWLKRAAESADSQYFTAPYELGLLHETGYGDGLFQDESYAAQLFTQSADLGHAEASYRLGDAYEHGKLHCPRDPALSVHFYTGAAQRGHPVAMMALCAWYMVGAEPVLEKDENEAYQWAKKAAECGQFCLKRLSLSYPNFFFRSSKSRICRWLLH